MVSGAISARGGCHGGLGVQGRELARRVRAGRLYRARVGWGKGPPPDVPADEEFFKLAAHPERVRVNVYDSNHNGADLVIDTPDGELRIEEGNLATMKTRAAELQAALDVSSLIDTSVGPHPFGLLAMGVIAMITLVGVRRVLVGGTSRPCPCSSDSGSTGGNPPPQVGE